MNEKEINKPEEEISIVDIFKDSDLVKKNDGNYKMECPSCGLQGGRTKGFILFPNGNRAYCFSSGRHFNILEAYALKKGLIKCVDGRETGQKENVLLGDEFKEVLDALREEYDDDFCAGVYKIIGLKERIELPNDGKLISTFANQLGEKTKNTNAFFYRNATQEIVELGKIKTPKGEIEYTGFVPVKPNRFITLIEKYYKPWSYKYTKKGGKLKINKSMPASIAQTVLVSDNFISKMPILNDILTVPLPMLYDGELTFPKPGYDARFASWLPYAAPTIIDPKMSLDKAKKLIAWIYREFCFESEQDRTHAIAGLITPFVRGLYKKITSRTPLFVQQANRERSGKEFCEGIRSRVYEGCFIEDPALSTGDKDSGSEELRKKLTAAFIQGRRKYHSSNNKGHINNATLEAAITKEHYSDRILGYSKTGSWPNIMEFSLSGNIGMTMTPDLINRSRFINLFLEMEDANKREFETPNLDIWVLEHRSEILSALYSLIRNWIDNKMPDGKIKFSSFPEWARVVGGIMEAAGYDSPCFPSKDMLGMFVDPKSTEMKEFYELCHKKFGDKYIEKQKLKEFIVNDEIDVFGEYDFNSKNDMIKFGKMLNTYINRIFSNIKMEVYDKTAKTQRWKYRFVKIDNEKKLLQIDKNKLDNNDGQLGQVGHHFTSIYLSPTRDTNNNERDLLPHLPQLPKIDEKTPQIDKIPEISDRQVQFWKTDECKDIVPNHTKKDILNWIKTKSEHTIKEMYVKFGVGSIKFKMELLKEGVIKQNGDKLKWIKN